MQFAWFDASHRTRNVRWNRTPVYPSVTVRRVTYHTRLLVHKLITRRDATRGPASYCEPGFRSAIVDNIRRRIVSVMFPPSIFEDRCVDFRRSKIDVSPFEDHVSPFEDRCHDVSTFGDQCVDFRRSMCRLRRWMC